MFTDLAGALLVTWGFIELVGMAVAGA